MRQIQIHNKGIKMKREKRIHRITKASLEVKKMDNEFYDHILEKVSDYDKDSWELTINSGGSICCVKNGGFTPIPGMATRFYGKGFGYPVRGIEIEGRIMFYRTPAQADADHKKMCEKHDREKRQAFKKHKKSMDADYDSLPDLFRRRIDKFRKNNSNFRWEYEGYEMFCCKEALKIANVLKTVEEIQKWKDLPWEEQKKAVEISDGHSGNTFGCAVSLACYYLSKCPENVVRLHGAMAPLVGSKEYGCVPKDNIGGEEE